MASHIMNLLLLVFCCSSAIWDGILGDVAGYGYRLASFGQGPTGGSWVGTLELIQKSSTYGADIPYLKLFVKHETNDRLRVHITDAAKQRWEVPYNLLPREQVPDLKSSLGAAAKVDTLSSGFEFSDGESELVFSFTTNPFGFAVKRKSGDVLFNTSGSSLVFKDQYLEISTSLPETASLYGLGENTQPHGIKIVPNEAYTLFTTDIAAINLNVDLYGSHPFYMDMRKGGISHGVLLLNSNGMDIFYKGNSLTYKVIGGVFDFYFFPGSSPLDVVEQYTSLIGRPAAMPYWAFGFHQCRWGYQNLSVVENVVYNYNKSQIPLDVIWNDDDHMDAAKDFTLDPINYPKEKLQAFLQQIHARGMKYVVLIDPGIAVNESYGTYTRGMQQDIFIKHEGEPFLGQVWPGAVYFPDFLHPQASSWWKDEIRRFRELAPVDGLWIDMNEVSNFCSGKCTIPKNTKCPGPGVVWECCLDCHNLTNTRWDIPPYAINITGKRLPVGFKTIATSAVHHDGILEYDAHSLYGFSQSIATHKALGELIGKRPFVLTRSTFVGSGKYAAHWTGDNQANWENLRYSISTILNFGMFGMPMVGSDICGFYPYTNEELCGRWIQLGAFYPFSRDHANYASTRQELYQWESVAISARKALGLRYRILPYLYTLNYEAHTTGAPIARPLFFTFPTDEKTYAISSQFLLGSSVLVSPVLYNKTTSVNAYFPEGSWYNLNDMTKMVESKGEEVMLDAPMDTINVHLYEGTVLPMQGGGLTTGQARSTPFTLVVALPSGNKGGKASGKLFLDNGDDMEMGLSAGLSTYVEFNAETDGKKVRVMSKVQHGEYALSQKWIIETVMVLGVSSSTSSVASIVVDGETVLGDAGYTVEAAKGGRFMELKGLSIPVGKSFDLSLSVNGR